MEEYGNIGVDAGKSNALDYYANQAAQSGVSYRDYLNTIAGGESPLYRNETLGLLNAVGNDGVINPSFTGQQQIDGLYNAGDSISNYDATRGQVQGGSEWYGPEGLGVLNNEYLSAYQKAMNATGNVLGSTTSSTSSGTGYTAADIAALEEKGNLLSNLLGRIDTSKTQGLGRIGDLYNQERANADIDKQQAFQGFDAQRDTQKTDREQAFEGAFSNANTNFRSLGNILGRASGSGSSAYRELLPHMLGNQLSADRRGILNTSGKNLQEIQGSQNQYETDFAQVLQDLMNQKKANEENLSSGIETQRQNYLTQQMANQAELAGARGGGYKSVQDAIAPYQEQYNQSLNQVDSFFDQFKPSFAPKELAAQAPELSTYNVDRATVNAQKAGNTDSNPYSALLRKKLQEQG